MYLSYLDVPILLGCTYLVWEMVSSTTGAAKRKWSVPNVSWPGLGSAVAVASHQSGDFTALLGNLLMHSVAESSLGLGDATEKLIMHLRVLVKEAAPGSKWMSLLTGPGKLES